MMNNISIWLKGWKNNVKNRAFKKKITADSFATEKYKSIFKNVVFSCT